MEKLKIDINDETLNFLLYLVNIKRYDGLSLWRVLHKPSEINNMYNDYLEIMKKRNYKNENHTTHYIEGKGE